MTNFVTWSILAILLHISRVQSLIVRRQFHDGILYEDYAAEADNVRYTITAGKGWDDLDKLVESNELRGKAMFCSRGPGTWLLYPAASYMFGTGRQLKLLIGEYCVPLDNINSIQPLGGQMNAIQPTSAAAFTEKYFGSEGQTVQGNDSVPSVKSLVFIGSSKWTVDDGSGKSICVAAMGAAGEVCLVEDAEVTFSAASGVTIKKGCEGNEMEVYGLQSCYSPGYHSLTYEMDFNLPSMTEICGASAYDSSNQKLDKFLRVMKVWKYRFLPDHASKGKFDAVVSSDVKIMEKIPDTMEKYQILVLMSEVMRRTCIALDPVYLELLVEIYFNVHAKNGEIWKSEDESQSNTTSPEWMVASRFMHECFNSINGNTGLKTFVTGCTPEEASAMRLESQIETIEDFLNGESFDFVIEQIWLMMNYITPYCTTVLSYSDNYWTEFPLLVKKQFLYPLREQWKNPGKWSNYYPLMFSGFDMAKGKKSMISCVQAMIMDTPSFDPLARPPGFLQSNDSSVKDIIGKATMKQQEEANKRRKRQRLDMDSEEEVGYSGGPPRVPVSPLPKPPTKVAPTRTNAPTHKPTRSTTTTTTTSAPTVQQLHAGITPIASGQADGQPKKKKKKSKHSKKGKKGGKSGKRRHSKAAKKGEKAHTQETPPHQDEAQA